MYENDVRDAAVITAAHAVLYADDPDRARAFFRDVLQMPNVDIHGGWLIFKLPPAELGVHPAGEASPSGHHELFLMCDDIDHTVTDLTARGVEFSAPITHSAIRTHDTHAHSGWRRHRSVSTVTRHRARPRALKGVNAVTSAGRSVP